jgi:chromosome segregation protein
MDNGSSPEADLPPPAPLTSAKSDSKGGRLAGQTYPLSGQLSCLIGSRGSGKSSVIEALRFALGIEPGSDDARYKNGLVEAILQNGGEIIVKGIGIDGSPITIQRALGYEPRVSVDGKETKLQPSDVFPGILYFGQKDLGNRHEDFEEEFFSQLLGRRSAAEFEEEAHLEDFVRKTVKSWNNTRTARKHEQSYRDEAERLRGTLDIYKKHGIEKQLEQLTQFDTDKRNLTDLIERYEERLTELAELPEDWEELADDWPVFKSSSLEALSEKLSYLKPRLVKNNKAFQSLVEEAAVKLHDFRRSQHRKEQVALREKSPALHHRPTGGRPR